MKFKIKKMSMKELVNDWLEEGFSRFTSAPDTKVSHEKTLIPYLKNDKGQNITPRPLFPAFVVDVELDPNFLVEYFEVIENTLSHGKGKLKKSFSKDKNGKVCLSEEISTNGGKLTPQIEYKRKHIYLSKVVFPLFEMPDYMVPKTSPHYEKVLVRNDTYKNSLDWRQSNSYDFCDQSTLVGYASSENKFVETIPVNLEDKRCLVNTFQMKAHYDRKELKTKTPLKTFQEFVTSKTKFQNYQEFLSNASENPSFLNNLKKCLYVMEKTLNYNTYKNTLLSYHDREIDLVDTIQKPMKNEDNEKHLDISKSSKDAMSSSKIDLKQHLKFYLSTMKENYTVSCLECNPKNSSIFVSGYGIRPSKETSYVPQGMVLCWNIHKCEYPEKIYHTEEAVTCVAFSKSQPFLVAAGMHYGLINVYDLRKSDGHSQVSNKTAKHRPTGTITGLKWKTKTYPLSKDCEILLAVSKDGVITTWNLGKTLEGDVLRTIKRGISDKHLKGRRKQLLLATDASATCLQVKPGDPNLFTFGTIEGQVLQVNFDSPEEYAQVYECHNGPTYDLQWSSVVEDVFGTCGGDLRVKIWEVGKAKSSKTISLQESVSKLALSHKKSTLFVAMTKSTLFIFDFLIHMHKPVVELMAKDLRFFTCVVFCPEKNWILVGDSGGVIDLYELVGVGELEGNQTVVLKNTFLAEY